jgi:cytochrome bd-type quinol oxidase subunit 2
MGRILLIVFIAFVQVWAFIEAIDTKNPRLMSRWAWLLVTALVPVIGPGLWFFAGRNNNRIPPPPPDDNPDFLKGL